MTPQEKTAKIADLEKQLRKIRRTIKGFPKPSKRWSAYKVVSYASRFVRLNVYKAILISNLQQIQSQKTT